jgi:hypothetical protein
MGVSTKGAYGVDGAQEWSKEGDENPPFSSTLAASDRNASTMLLPDDWPNTRWSQVLLEEDEDKSDEDGLDRDEDLYYQQATWVVT